MILLEFHNRIIEETLTQIMDKPPKSALDITIADFDGVSFHIHTPAEKESRHLVTVSMAWGCADALLAAGGQAEIEKIYGAFLVQPEAGYQVSLLIDTAQCAADPNLKEKVPRSVSLLKRHVLAGPFLQAFAQINGGGGAGDMQRFEYRADESLFIKADADSCTVCFSISFKDPDDQMFARVFLQEFAGQKVRGAPALSFKQREVPLELANYADLQDREDLGFVTFVLFKNHLDARNAHNTIDMVQTFRNYLQYHIKCSKAHMHERMRNRVASLLQVLNRAKPEPVEARKKKIWGGKSFRGAGSSKALGAMGRGGGPSRGRGRGRGFAK